MVMGIFLVQASIKTAYMVNWKINKDRITELYCVNKNNPLMHCEGKCYLSLQLKAIEKEYQQSKAPFSNKQFKEVELLLFVERFSSLDLQTIVFSTETVRGGRYQLSFGIDSIHSLYQPPQYVSLLA